MITAIGVDLSKTDDWTSASIIGCEGVFEITCPHCGYIESDSWEYASDADGYLGEETCDSCEKKFEIYRNVTVDYSTYKIEKESDDDA